MNNSKAARPVTLARLARAARLAGHSAITQKPTLLVFDHGSIATTTIEPDEGDPESPEYIVTTTHHTPLSFDALRDAAELVNDWNHDCLTPTLVLNFDSTDEVGITGTTVIDGRQGMTDEQLVAAADQAIDNASAFVHKLVERFPTVTLTPPVTLRDEGLASEPDDAFDNQAYAVDTDRIAASLASIGIDKLQRTDATEGKAIYAWINEVLFAFVLDNGPSLVVKGHWDPDLPGSEFLRACLVCNDFNRMSDSPVAYCHSNVDGLQIRLDLAVTVAAGMTDRQLRSTLGTALKTMLHGVDHISKEVSGQSPVSWP